MSSFSKTADKNILADINEFVKALREKYKGQVVSFDGFTKKYNGYNAVVDGFIVSTNYMGDAEIRILLMVLDKKTSTYPLNSETVTRTFWDIDKVRTLTGESFDV